VSLGKGKEAAKYFERALEIDPDYSLAKSALIDLKGK